MAQKVTTFEIQGKEKLLRALSVLGPKSVKVAAGSLYRSAEKVMTVSKEDYCPVDTGNLKSTGVVVPPEIRGSDAIVQLGYGGPAADYAVFVHETNKNYRNGKQWKYLETPLMLAGNQIVKDLKKDLEDEAFNTHS